MAATDTKVEIINAKGFLKGQFLLVSDLVSTKPISKQLRRRCPDCRGGHVEASLFGNEEPGARAGCRADRAFQRIMIRIVPAHDVDPPLPADDVEALALRVEEDIVRILPDRLLRHDLSRIDVVHEQHRRPACSDEQPSARLVERHRIIGFRAGNAPRCGGGSCETDGCRNLGRSRRGIQLSDGARRAGQKAVRRGAQARGAARVRHRFRNGRGEAAHRGRHRRHLLRLAAQAPLRHLRTGADRYRAPGRSGSLFAGRHGPHRPARAHRALRSRRRAALRGRTGNRNITRQTAYLSTSLNLQKGSSLAHATEHVLLRTSKKEYIMKRKERRYFHVFPLIAAFVVAGWLGWQPARAEGDSKELQAVAQALVKSKLSLLAGIRQASQGSAKAISAKFELEDGKLSLSVYTAEKGLAVPAERNVLQELSGSPEQDKWTPKVEIFKDVPHVARSAEQLTVMSLGRKSLAAIIAEVQKTHPGTVFSITPAIKNRKSVAVVLIAQKGKVTTVTQPL